MRKLLAFALMLATVVPAAAQTTKRISQYPAAAALTGSERQLADQGNGCTSSPIAPPCTTVYITPAQISAYLQGIIAPTLALSNPSGDTVLSLTANTASGTVAYDRLDFGRIGGTVNAQIRSASQINNDYGYLEFWTRGTDGFNCRSRLDLAGYFGVLTCAPATPLDVNGSGTIRGALAVTGTITAPSLTGNAGTATALATARAINGVAFDGTAPITINAVDSTARLAVANNLSDLANAATARINLGVTATGADPAYAKLTGATFTGAITASNLSGSNTGDQTNITGNAGTATALQTGRTISTTGDVSYTSSSFNGTANVTGTATLVASGVTAGTYGGVSGVPSLVIDAKGRATSASNVVLGVAGGGTGDTGTAWTIFTPTASCASGALTSYTATGRYKIIGKTVNISILVTVGSSGLGSCSGYLVASLPVVATNGGISYILAGRDGATSKMIEGLIQSGSSSVIMQFYDGSNPAANNASANVTGTYEAQ